MAGAKEGPEFEAVRAGLRVKVEKGHTFLYTALLAAKARRASTHEKVLELLDDAASDVPGLYEQAANRIRHDLEESVQRGCIDALAVVATTYRPLHHSELCALSDIDVKFRRPGFSVDNDESWVTWDSNPVLWLPP